MIRMLIAAVHQRPLLLEFLSNTTAGPKQANWEINIIYLIYLTREWNVSYLFCLNSSVYKSGFACRVCKHHLYEIGCCTFCIEQACVDIALMFIKFKKGGSVIVFALYNTSWQRYKLNLPCSAVEWVVSEYVQINSHTIFTFKFTFKSLL